MPKDELGYGDVDARPDGDGGAAVPTNPAAMNDSGHAVADEAPKPVPDRD